MKDPLSVTFSTFSVPPGDWRWIQRSVRRTPLPDRALGIHGGQQRGVPDVAYNAAILHGVLTYLDIPGVATGFYTFGGTSAVLRSGQPSQRLRIRRRAGGWDFSIRPSTRSANIDQRTGDPASFHDITSGTNSALEFDSSGNPVTVIGFSAGKGWDPTTGIGSPIAPGLVQYLIKNVSPGDGQAAIATTGRSLIGSQKCLVT